MSSIKVDIFPVSATVVSAPQQTQICCAEYSVIGEFFQDVAVGKSKVKLFGKYTIKIQGRGEFQIGNGGGKIRFPLCKCLDCLQFRGIDNIIVELPKGSEYIGQSDIPSVVSRDWKLQLISGDKFEISNGTKVELLVGTIWISSRICENVILSVL